MVRRGKSRTRKFFTRKRYANKCVFLARMHWKACEHPLSACKRAACIHASTYAGYVVRAVHA
jgi:hypothetical protein